MSLITAPTLKLGAYYVQGKVQSRTAPAEAPGRGEKLVKLSTDLTGAAGRGL